MFYFSNFGHSQVCHKVIVDLYFIQQSVCVSFLTKYLDINLRYHSNVIKMRLNMWQVWFRLNQPLHVGGISTTFWWLSAILIKRFEISENVKWVDSLVHRQQSPITEFWTWHRIQWISFLADFSYTALTIIDIENFIHVIGWGNSCDVQTRFFTSRIYSS